MKENEILKNNYVKKKQVYNFWNDASCGENLLLQTIDKDGYISQSAERYRLEPFILTFANFESSKGKSVLEIGVGLGADHQQFAESGAILFGIDLTERAVIHTRRRLNLFGLTSTLSVGDAEQLNFTDKSFDLVYSWGVLHHSPETPKAISEVFRVLKKGGTAKIMIYHKWSIIGVMLWTRYGLFSGKPWKSMEKIYSEHLESPGTKAYSISEAQSMFSEFTDISISTPLTHGDLLLSNVGQRHRGFLLTLAKLIWPRWFIRRFFSKSGLFMMIEARK